MMRARNLTLGVGLFAALVSCSGCGNGEAPVTILCKDFAEQTILAEMAADLLRDAGLPVDRVRSVPDSYQAQAMLREGSVDLMVDYSGTALNFLGELDVSGDSSIEYARERYAPIGLDWLDPLGFDNGYAVLVPSVRAASLGLRSIEDLADPEKFPEGVRVACPPEFLRRPGDGLGPLSEAYGFRLASPPLVIGDVLERMRALESRRVDVAIGFATDGVIPTLGLRVLDDSQGFFPLYEAAFVVRHEAMTSRPKLAEALGTLAGRLDERTMQRLNAEVEIKGRRPSVVAREFLIEHELIADEPRGRVISTRPDLALAIAEQDEFYELRARTVVAIREAFPDRSVTEARVEDPAEAVSRGRARLALMGAERFFWSDGDSSPDQEDRVEAAAVVGTRLVHLVRRSDDEAADPLSGRIGVPPIGSGAEIVARSILGDDRQADASGTPRELLDAVRDGQLDAALLLLPVGDLEMPVDPESVQLLELRSLPGWLTPSRAVRAPFLRPARIAAESYPGQPEAIETLGVQVLIAGPGRQAVPLTANSGPAAALTLAGLPLEPDEVEALAAATGIPEAPDPTLPSSWSRRPSRSDLADPSAATSVFSTLLNVLAIAFVIWIIRLAMQAPKAPTSGAITAGEPAPRAPG